MTRDYLANYATKKQDLCIGNDTISDSLFKEYGVNRGLRDIMVKVSLQVLQISQRSHHLKMMETETGCHVMENYGTEDIT